MEEKERTKLDILQAKLHSLERVQVSLKGLKNELLGVLIDNCEPEEVNMLVSVNILLRDTEHYVSKTNHDIDTFDRKFGF
jgi:hypothetical protein